MQYDHVKTLFDSDSSLFEPWKLPEEWLDDWIVTSPKDLDRLDAVYDNYESTLSNESENLVEDRKPKCEKVNLPDAIQDHYRIGKWPETPNMEPSVDALAFYLPFHHSPDKHGIYIMEEGVEYLAALIYLIGGGKISEQTARTSSLYFIYFHEVFHHKVEMLATRWELVGRKPFYIDSLRKFFIKGKGTEDWPEETLANVFGYEKCINKMKTKISSEELQAVKVSLVVCIRIQPEGYRVAADIIEKSGASQKILKKNVSSFGNASMGNTCLKIRVIVNWYGCLGTLIIH